MDFGVEFETVLRTATATSTTVAFELLLFGVVFVFEHQ